MKRKAVCQCLVLVGFISFGAFWPTVSIGAAPDPDVISAAKKEGEVVVYTTGRRELLEDLSKRYEQKYGIPVKWTKKTDTGVVQSVEAERRSGKIRCDVVEVGYASNYLVWQRDGLFLEYTARNMEEIMPPYRPKGRFAKFVTPKFVNLQAIAFNTKQLKAAEAPKTWKDLVNPKWKGRISFVDPRTGAPGKIVVDILRSLYGWTFLEQFARMDLMLGGTGYAVSQNLILGEATIGAAANAADVVELRGKGEPIDFNFPEDGAPAYFNYAAIVKSAAHPAAAKLWVEWMMSPEAQTEFSKAGYRVLRSDVPDTFKGYTIKMVEPDWDWLEKNESEQSKRFISYIKKVK